MNYTDKETAKVCAIMLVLALIGTVIMATKADLLLTLAYLVVCLIPISGIWFGRNT